MLGAFLSLVFLTPAALGAPGAVVPAVVAPARVVPGAGALGFVAPAVVVPARFRPPVVAIIFDHFRPPACLWCAGNRGIDYAVASGTPVTAAGVGQVEFAGPVGRDLFVVVAHPDGLRTTYAFLTEVRVTRGQSVLAGDVVGLSGDDLHFGVRRGATYLDPEPFLVTRHMRARLVA